MSSWPRIGLLSAIFLAGVINDVVGHTTQICSTASPTLPGRVVLWWSTYHYCGENAVGTATVVTPSGTSYVFSFTSCCAPGCVPQENIALIESRMRSNCQGLRANNMQLVDSNTVVQCFYQAPANTLPGQSNVGLPHPSRTNAASAKVYNPGCAYFGAALDNLAPGWYNAKSCGTNYVLDPWSSCCYPWAMACSRPWWFQLSAMGPGPACTAQAPSQYSVNSGAPFSILQSLCTNRPDGYLCPASCNSGYTQVGNPICSGGSWGFFSCVASNSGFCQMPTSGNNAGTSNGGVYANGIIASSVSPVCGAVSENGASCSFSCTNSLYFGRGRINCQSGTWVKNDAQVTCFGPSQDSLQPPPTITGVSISGGNANIQWAPANDGIFRSPVSQYTFQVIPTGSLTCAPFNGAIPPSGGHTCTGGQASNMMQYQISVRAQNLKGWGTYSAPQGFGCDPTAVPYTQPSTVYTDTCGGGLGPGDTCTISCRSPYVGNVATVTCLSLALAGPLPTCLTRAQAPINVVVTPMSTTSVQVTWDAQSFGSVGQDPSPAGYSCNGNTDCTGQSSQSSSTQSTLDDCATACTNDGSCTVFTWEALSNQCLVKTDFTTTSAVSPALKKTCCTANPPVAGGSVNTPLLPTYPFSGWEVQVRRTGQSSWTTWPGCQGLTDRCGLQCAGSQLLPRTSYDVQVKVGCTQYQAISSPYSSIASGETLPTPAGAPGSLVVSDVADTTAVLTWTAGSAGNCDFQSWLVELQGTSTFFAGEPAGCQSMTNRNTLTCTLTGLSCQTTFTVRVSESCSNGLATSPPSATETFMTLISQACIEPIGAPTVTSFTRHGNTHNLAVSWSVPNSMGDCTFQSFLVQFRESSGGGFREVYGCTGLSTWNTRSCVGQAFLATSGSQQVGWDFVNYRAAVTIRCTDARADSARSTESGDMSPLPYAHDQPLASTGTMTPQGFTISWSVPEMNDCAFTSYDVSIYSAGKHNFISGLPTLPFVLAQTVSGYASVASFVAGSSAWSLVTTPPGCTGLTSPCTTSCTMTQLTSYTDYAATLAVRCEDSEAEAAPVSTGSSWVTLTAPIQQGAPTSPTVTAVTDDGGNLAWTAAALSVDCFFLEWEVNFQEDGRTTWQTTSGCMSVSSIGQTSCTFTALNCDTTYRARVRQKCLDPAATSDYATTSTFTTLKTGTCLRGASPPNFVGLASDTAGYQTLDLSWTAGAANDCHFDHFEVQYQQTTGGVSQEWYTIFAGTCAGTVTPRGGGTCRLQGLFPNQGYKARVREICNVTMLNSGWSESLQVFTLSVPDIVDDTKIPLGTVTETRPSSLITILSTNVVLNLNAIQPATTGWAEKCANQGEPCMCTGTVYYGRRYAQSGVENTFVQMNRTADRKTVSDINGIVGCRPDCLTGTGVHDGLCVTGTSATHPYACWCEAAQQPAPAQLTVCPSTNAPEPNSCGCTGPACSDLCAAPTVGNTGVYMLSPSIVWNTFASDFNVGSGCTYVITMDAGYLKTTVQPPKKSPAFVWNFVYDPAPPLLALQLQTPSPGALTILATWSEPTSFSCWITGLRSLTEESGNYVSSPAALTLEGLSPSASWGVTCEGNPVNDPWNIAQSSGGPFETSDDTNAKLGQLEVIVDVGCNDSGWFYPTTRALDPGWAADDAGQTYNVRIDVTGYRTTCGYPDTVDLYPQYRARLNISTQSPFAAMTINPAARENYVNLTWLAGQNPINPDTGDAVYTVPMSASIIPFTSAPTQTYVVLVTALFANVQFTSITVNPEGDLKPDGSSVVDIGLTMELGVSLAGLQLKFGEDNAQSSLEITSNTGLVSGRQQQIVNVRVNGAAGYGDNLDVLVILGGITYTAPASFQVTFELAVILGSNSLPVCFPPDPINNAGIQDLAGRGTPQGIIPTTGVTPACDMYNTEAGAACYFNCSTTGSWGFRKLRCGPPDPLVPDRKQGTWFKDSPDAACYFSIENSVWNAPTMSQLDDEGSGVMRVFWDWEQNFSEIRSDPTLFRFNVVPGGSLVCPDYIGLTPPEEGHLCTGGISNNMGIYQIKTQVVNLAGRGPWSAPMQRACPDLEVPPLETWRYNLDSCSGLIDQETCQVTCTPATVLVGTLPVQTCVPPDQPSGDLPACYQQALAPLNVIATGVSDSSLRFTWVDGGLNDCGSLVPFLRWVVEVREPGGTWEEPAGCQQVSSPCTTECTAIELISNTTYQVQVSVSCLYNEVSSEASIASQGMTWPTVVEPPQNPQVDTVGTTTLGVSWESNGEQGDCTFESWLVELQGPSGTWSSNPDGCANLNDLSTSTCELIGLTCDTVYSYRVSQICTDPLANSLPSDATNGQTLRDGTCLIPATQPSDLLGNPLDPATVVLSWTAGVSGDCTFQSWRVRIRRSYNGDVSEWQTNPGCTNLISRAPSTCTAIGLIRGTYHFYVVEECRDPQTNSQLSQMSPDIIMPLRPAEAPTGVVPSEAAVFGFFIEWNAEDQKDCTFLNWQVQVLKDEPGAEWESAGGDCTAAVSPCDTFCTAGGLSSNMHYWARVKMMCVEGAEPESPWSEPSNPTILTLPQQSLRPTNLVASAMTLTSVDLSWTPATPSPDCVFSSWEVGVQIDTYTTWSLPNGCDDITSRTTTACVATGLICDTGYTVRVREVCSLSGATSPYRTGAAFRTQRSVTCLRPATSPQAVRASAPTTTTLLVIFTAGTQNDCVFGGFKVERRKEGEATWVNVGGSCDDVQSRAGPSCVAEGLEDGVSYLFRAKELCSNGEVLNSAWGIAEELTMTIAVPPVTIVAEIPVDAVEQSRPTSVLIVYAVDVRIDETAYDNGARLRVCPSTTSMEENSCGCMADTCPNQCLEPRLVGQGGGPQGFLNLLNPQVLLYDFTRYLEPGSHCLYTVNVDPGLVTTVMTPTKASPLFNWNFTFSPPPPELTLVQVGETITTLRLAVAWSKIAKFNCSVADYTPISFQDGEYTGVNPVEITLSGLIPSATYSVECYGEEIEDRWSTNTVRKTGFVTADDTNNLFQSMVVAMRPVCCDTCDPLDAFYPVLSPEFDAQRRDTSHSIRIDVSDFRDPEVCNIPANEAATVRYHVSVEAAAMSQFGRIVNEPADAMIELDWPANQDKPVGEARVNIATAVYPYTGGSASQNRISIEVVALFANLKVVSVTPSDDPMPVDGTGNAMVTITTEVGIPLAGLVLKIGTYAQTYAASATEQIVDNTGATLDRTNYTINNVFGIGFRLPIIIQLGSLEFQSSYTITFAQPMITNVATGAPGQSLTEALFGGSSASMSQDTLVLVQGQNLVVPPQYRAEGQALPEIYIIGVATSCNTTECQTEAIVAAHRNNVPNLCGATNYTELAEVIQCSLPPSNVNPLAIGVFFRNGTVDMSLGSLANPTSSVVEYEAPKPSTPVKGEQLSLSGTGELSITGDFPSNEVTGGYLQIYASKNDFPPPEDTLPDNIGDDYLPLCASTRVENGELKCDRFTNLDASKLQISTPLIWIRYGPTLFSKESDPSQYSYLSVPVPEIAGGLDEGGRSDEYESDVFLTFRGSNFGTDANGPLVIDFQTEGNETLPTSRSQANANNRRLQTGFNTQKPGTTTSTCDILTRNDTLIECHLAGSVFGDDLNDSAYESEYTDPNTTFEYPVWTTVRYAGVDENADLPPVPGAQHLLTSLDFTVKLFVCPPGQFRVNKTAKVCEVCPRGEFKNSTGTALACLKCPIGRYSDLTGAVECRTCAEGYTTRDVGSVRAKECVCAPGWFVDLRITGNASGGPHDTGVCKRCPNHAICEGFAAQPYSEFGYWSLDQRRFWECYPNDACLQGSVNGTNLCSDGRKPDGRRCVECMKGFYRYRSQCHQCKTHDRVIAWVAPVAIILGVLFILVPQSVKAFHKERTLSKGLRKDFREDGWLFRIMPANKWPGPLRRLAAPNTPSVRLVVLAFNRLQLIWALGQLPVAWNEAFQDQLTFLGIFSFDYDILRPECMRDPATGFSDFMEWAYFTKWFTQWISPYFILGLLVLGLLVNSLRHREHTDRRFIHFQTALLATISIQALLQLMSHTVDNLYFIKCMSCEDNNQCMVDFPLNKCDFARLFQSDMDGSWFAIAFISFLDLVFVTIPLFSGIAFAIYKSWSWQHGIGSGVSTEGHMPWFLALSEFWVMHYKGYNVTLRKEAIVLRDLMRKLIKGNVDLHEVWEHCVHQTNFERWRRVGKTLQFHVDSVVRFIEIQRKHGVRSLLRLKQKPENLSDEDLMQINGILAAYTSRTERARRRREQYTMGLEEHLKYTQIFIKEVEGSVNPMQAGSLFWTYSWEVMLLLQKLLVIIIAMSSNPDTETVTLAACFFFMLIVLIVEVKMEPHEWDFLNSMEVVMNILTLYLVVFAQLEWVNTVFAIAVVISVVTIVPVLLRFALPTYPNKVTNESWAEKLREEEEEMDEDFFSTDLPLHEIEQVKLAMMESSLGFKGKGSLAKMQGLMKWKARQNWAKRDAEEGLGMDLSDKEPLTSF